VTGGALPLVATLLLLLVAATATVLLAAIATLTFWKIVSTDAS
jgi:hypothetical protein